MLANGLTVDGVDAHFFLKHDYQLLPKHAQVADSPLAGNLAGELFALLVPDGNLERVMYWSKATADERDDVGTPKNLNEADAAFAERALGQ